MTDLGRGSAGVLRALRPELTPARGNAARLRQLVAEVPQPTLSESWLILAVLGRALPTASEVRAFQRRALAVGLPAALGAIRRGRIARFRWFGRTPRVVSGIPIVDVHETATSGLSTGVQRVSRALGDRLPAHGALLVGWSSNRRSLRIVRPDAWSARRRGRPFSGPPVVVWRGAYLLPEVVGEVERSARIEALCEFSQSRSVLIGLDAIPLTSAETTGPKMPGVFAKYLAAASRMTAIACISEAAGVEYRGWGSMLAAAGIPSPAISVISIAEVAGEAVEAERASAEALLLATDAEGQLPLVVCVGSHEPRKNHAAVLQAAELLWRDGVRFRLVFIGGNAWRSDAFRMRVAELRSAGRAVSALSGVSDAVLWWAYRLATVTVFPSLNEGFGLPVTESLMSGTPVVTSNYGSMAELAAGGGCITVDPRDDNAIAAGLRVVLTDEKRRHELITEAAKRTGRSWDAYADDVLALLVP
jgi:glycosyltransferase involved in cell wall biosynthesis